MQHKTDFLLQIKKKVAENTAPKREINIKILQLFSLHKEMFKKQKANFLTNTIICIHIIIRLPLLRNNNQIQ